MSTDRIIRHEIEILVSNIEKSFSRPHEYSTHTTADPQYGGDIINLSIRLDEWNEFEFTKNLDEMMRMIRRFKELRAQEIRINFETEKQLLIKRQINGPITQNDRK